MAMCKYPSNSLATGFQMMAQQTSNSNQVHKLYVSQASRQQLAAASVEVEENGTYQVSIFAVRGGRGILDSNVEYTEEVVLFELNPEGMILIFLMYSV